MWTLPQSGPIRSHHPNESSPGRATAGRGWRDAQCAVPAVCQCLQQSSTARLKILHTELTTACFNDSHTLSKPDESAVSHQKQTELIISNDAVYSGVAASFDKRTKTVLTCPVHTASSRCQCVFLYLHLGAVCWYLHLWSAQCHCISHHSRRGSCQSNHTVIYGSGICCFSAATETETTQHPSVLTMSMKEQSETHKDMSSWQWHAPLLQLVLSKHPLINQPGQQILVSFDSKLLY